MYKKKPVFLTDEKGGIYKVEKLIKAVVLKNLETNERLTVEHPLAGFAIINMPKVEDTPVSSPKSGSANTPESYKSKKIRNKSSQYFGVSLDKKTNKWRACAWIGKANIYLGTYETEIEAAKAVDVGLERGGLPKRNFP